MHGDGSLKSVALAGVWVRVSPGAHNLLNWEAYSRVAQLAEPSTVNRMVPGSSPGTGACVTCTVILIPWLFVKDSGRLAQLVEHRLYTPRVAGSSPVLPT